MTQLREPEPVPATVDLDDRYRTTSGPVLVTGIQAIARLLVEQHERDRRAGARTATFVSGYQGSPLGGLDRLLASLPMLAADHNVHLTPGVNEELAATSVWGSQIELPAGERTHDGVVGVWYGKGPGLDRAGDALRHATMYGAHPSGGALALVGDDPAAKSSTLPAASEKSLAALGIPVFFPRNAEEVVAFGMYGIALSRASGCWSALKIVADVADGLWTLDRDFAALPIVTPTVEWEGAPWTYRQRVLAAPPDSLLAEADLHGPRWAMVEAFTEANPIDRIEVDSTDARIGVVAVGTAYDAVRQSLRDLGVTDSELGRAGVRILRVGMPFPLASGTVRQLAEGVDTILVVEEKTAFVESQVKEILYGSGGAPEVVGKRNRNGRRLVPADGELTAARLARPLREVLHGRVTLRAPLPAPLELTVLPARRAPYFCSGCPHNRSTVVPEGSLAGGGIGCHTLVTMSARTESRVTGLTQMGGEGAQWIGQSPFTSVPHIFQNIGDGTYFHSGQLAVQACLAAGVNITYKILYNSAVAMTGAQDAEGALPVPELTHQLAAEGVAKIIVCADDPARHRRAHFARGVTVWDRDRLDEAQRILRGVPGVTVLIYDQQCAAEARRKRKRGTLPVRTTRVVINEAVCEGCGDCGAKSNCLSVQPVDTEFGRKTHIDQTGCNTDYSCLDGNCPSFVTVEVDPDGAAPGNTLPEPPVSPEPRAVMPADGVTLFLAGVGGTGIVTVNQVLGTAALHCGLHVEGLDQTGLSQKAGPVTSHLRITPDSEDTSNRLTPGSADCILAFDLLTAADSRFVGYGSASRTLVVASTSRTPTGDMVRDPSVEHPDMDALLDRLRSVARQVRSFDAAAAARKLFGGTASVNFLLVGAAYQCGALPFAASAIEEAIALNGVAVDENLAAFRWGRAGVAHPRTFDAATRTDGAPATPRSDVTALLERRSFTGPTRELVERRAAELVAYQGTRIATDYIDVVDTAWHAERALGTNTAFSEAVATGLFTLTAYKDEYEVARLLTDPDFTAHVAREVPGSGAPTYLLHPPVLKALGRRKKIRLGPRTHWALTLLAHGRRLRGTALDPFGHTRIRRIERALAAHYSATVQAHAAGLGADNYDTAVAVAEAAGLVRGYEEVKMRNVAIYLDRLDSLGVDTGAIRALTVTDARARRSPFSRSRTPRRRLRRRS
ncbi:indolepyruvate ferredoxin oxidoreductase family protein [Rhodococcus triatomae]|uniref:Indolepyruvate ferredoxin oxidoreductase n=1 Tax=Rhodococcus triatomae TaxID=300028 RepID=A0A1G8LBJ7_9NOCA|nr:indolepyruvate ferredoxin oxidoreductase family protein [Rhodococcus triatomae]QNG20556.1 indolepyruvate ferredoxin oxidoreductase family protein [Rhodococcus triatomae]QNG23526.1 indolepyruvate ferredoxin oxidoreductase family protein [Rhodococcus triatomae]SDI53098.1 indolepyruvate ferredoxin oxidoreductase [Rhodococcus triatomae]